MSNLRFDELRTANRKRAEYWHDGKPWHLNDWFTALVGEVGEAANVAKKLKRIEDGLIGSKAFDDEKHLREKLRLELADIQIYLDLIADHVDVDLGAATVEKFNLKSTELGIMDKFKLGRTCEFEGCGNPCAEKLGWCPLCYDT